MTLVDLGRELLAPGFLVPTLVLAATTGALAVAVGFLPLIGRQEGLGTVGSMAIVTVLAVVSSVVQPLMGAWHDRGRVSVRLGSVGGLLLIAVGVALAAMWTTPLVLIATAVLVGAGVGAATPVAFSHLAASTPPERMGRTMGSAELGRELGDAGGPLVAGAVATATVPGVGLGVVAALTAGAGALALFGLRSRSGREV
nr:MFS transporter [Microbacterium barkeri]